MEFVWINLHTINKGVFMKFWLFSGLVVGIILLSYITHADHKKESYIKNPNLCHDNDDLLVEQDL